MSKISGLSLGEAKKISGVGGGAVKKVSGLGSGLIWQDAVTQGMYKDGDFLVTGTQQILPSWTAEPNATVVSDSIQIATAGNYHFELRAVADNTNGIGSRWLQMWVFKNSATPAVLTGHQQTLGASSTGNIYTISTATPTACVVGDLISCQCRAQALNSVYIRSGIGTYLRAIPVT